ncbi:MAG: N-acetyltransferase family protein [Vicinamibacterales bacterium]
MPPERFTGAIRPAGASDVPSLLPLVREYWAFEGIAGFDAARVAAALVHLLQDAGRGAGWIALDEERPVGYVLLVYVFSLEHLGLTAEIDELSVVSSHRGHGVGTALLAAAEAGAAAAGCVNVSLQLGHDNTRARAFYQRCGFRPRAGYALLEKTLGASQA